MFKRGVRVENIHDSNIITKKSESSHKSSADST